MRIVYLSVFFLSFLPLSLFAQQPEDEAVPITVEINVDTPSVSLSWELGVPTADYLLLLRREKDSTAWYIFIDSLGANITSLIDPLVEVGRTYEYFILRIVNGVTGYGFMTVPIQAPVVDSRGKVLLLVEQALENPLDAEINRLEGDMEGDGFHVVRHLVDENASVQDVKDIIVDEYNADPENVKSVFLLGEIPVPYSGNANWDGHNDHAGAWVADTYYGDVDGIWTDISVNNTTPSRPANDNIPGDGKFDHSSIPDTIDLAVGRVDFSNLNESLFGASHTELIKRYLDKNHKWRTKQYTAENRALVDDNFGYFGGEAFSGSGYRNYYSNVGKDNVEDGDWFTDSDTTNWLFGYGCGGGSYVSAGGIGHTNQFAADSVNIVFSMLFGSYFGDWDSEDNPFMPAALASKGGILSCSWAGRPHWFYHAMAAGESLGYCATSTQNARFSNVYSLIDPKFGMSGPHVTLLGDPTLRAHIVAPVSDVVVTNNCNTVDVAWTSSSAPNVMGYHVYRSEDFNGGYTRLTTDPIMGTSFTDDNPPNAFLLYNIKAVVLEETTSGSYYNTSTGKIGNTFFESGVQPSISASSETIDCLNSQVTVTSTTNAEIPFYQWSGPNGFTSEDPDITTGTPGNYQLIVTDFFSGCADTIQVDVMEDMNYPTANAGADAQINCANLETDLDGTMSSSGAIYTYEWTTNDGNIVSGGNSTAPVVNAAGTYQLLVTNTDNGCTQSDQVLVNSDFNYPTSEAGASMQIDCNNSTVNLDGTGSSIGNNFSYHWISASGTILMGGTTLNPEVGECATYTLEVTDSNNGCVSSDEVIVTCDFELPNISISGDFIIECNAPAMLTASSTTPNPTYQWTGPGIVDPSLSNQTISIPGVYSVVVTNEDNGCTNSSSFTVDQDNSLPQADPSVLGMLDCTSLGVTLQANPDMAGYIFAWTGPNNYNTTDENPFTNEPGIYSLTLTNVSNGCSSSFSVEVEDNTIPPIANAGQDEILNCLITSVILDGTGSSQGANYSYNWATSNGQIISGGDTMQPEVIACGTYFLTVLNTLTGCESTDMVVVDCDIAVPNADAGNGYLLDCQTIEIALNGQNSSIGADFTYEWQGPSIISGANTLTPVVNEPGTYTLIVTNTANGCTNSAVTEVLADQTGPDLSINGELLIPCFGGTTILEAISSVPNVIFEWTGPGVSDPNAAMQEVGEGSYSVSVLGLNGCITTETIEVFSNPELTMQVISTIDCDGYHHPSVVAMGGTGPYTFVFTPEFPIPPGTDYMIILTDSEGCSLSYSDTTPPFDPIELSISHTDESVLGANDGTATAEIMFGIAPYVYSWDNGETTQTITGLSPGTYILTITDAAGCEDVASVEILPGPMAAGDIPGLQVLSIFPNPTNGFFELNLEMENPKALVIEILDLKGRVLQTIKSDRVSTLNQKFDLSAYASGVYWCKITAGGNSISQRIVKF